jgi:hypothetical protein
MQIEDSALDRTPDLVAKVRALRAQAEKEMNQFTCAGDYDIRRVVGQKPKPEEKESAPASGGAKKKRAKSSPDQTAIEFSPAPPERGDEAADQ